MAKEMFEITPMERELSSGSKIPMSYTTLARTVYLDDGTDLMTAWKENIQDNALPVISQMRAISQNYAWNVIRYGRRMVNASIHITGVVPTSVVVSNNSLVELLDDRAVVTLNSSLIDTAILTYHVDLPKIYISATESTYIPTGAVAVVNPGDNCSFAEAGKFPFGLQTSIEAMPGSVFANDYAVKIRVIVSNDVLESIFENSGNGNSDFNINVTSILPL